MLCQVHLFDRKPTLTAAFFWEFKDTSVAAKLAAMKACIIASSSSMSVFSDSNRFV